MNSNEKIGQFSSVFPNMHLFNDPEKQVIGLFGPQSQLWSDKRFLVTRVSIVPLFLLILANPVISSYKPFFQKDSSYVLERAKLLSIYSARLIYGDLSLVQKTALELWEAHKRVHWEVDGKQFHALQSELMVWTWACVYFVHKSSIQLFIDQRNDISAEKLYAEFLLLGEAFGILKKHLPSTLNDFEEYWQDQLQNKINITQPAQDVCDFLFKKSKSSIINSIFKTSIPKIIIGPCDHFIRLITLKLLPQTVLLKYKLTYNGQQEKSLHKYLKFIRLVMRILPSSFRYKQAAILAYQRCVLNR